MANVTEWLIHGAVWGLIRAPNTDPTSPQFYRLVQITEWAYLLGWLALLSLAVAVLLDPSLRLARRAAAATFATIFLLGLTHTV
ncbi:MAG: hypothetical protein ACRYGF_12030 [Janthinobacterium lividum]